MPKLGDTQTKQDIDRVTCLELLEQGKSPTFITSVLKRSLPWVYKTKNERSSIYKCKTKLRSGRPSKLISNIKSIIKKTRGKRKRSTRKVSKQIKDKTKTSISHVTVWKFQKKEKQLPYKRRREPLLSNKNIVSRTNFAKKYGLKPCTFWDNWLFTDEKYFGLSERSNSKNDVV